MGQFDDLIPSGTAVAEPPAVGAFDDLIPKPQQEQPPNLFPAPEASVIQTDPHLLPPQGEQSTIYGGPPKKFGTDNYAELMSEFSTGPETPVMRFVAPKQEPAESRIAFPKVPIAPDAGFWTAAASEVVNVLKGIPEFFTSDLGIASLVAAKLSPRLVSAGFTADMGRAAFLQAKDAYQNWDQMTPAQQGVAVVDTLASLVMGGTAGAHALHKFEIPGFRSWEQDRNLPDVQFAEAHAQANPITAPAGPMDLTSATAQEPAIPIIRPKPPVIPRVKAPADALRPAEPVIPRPDQPVPVPSGIPEGKGRGPYRMIGGRLMDADGNTVDAKGNIIAPPEPVTPEPDSTGFTIPVASTAVTEQKREGDQNAKPIEEVIPPSPIPVIEGKPVEQKAAEAAPAGTPLGEGENKAPAELVPPKAEPEAVVLEPIKRDPESGLPIYSDADWASYQSILARIKAAPTIPEKLAIQPEWEALKNKYGGDTPAQTKAAPPAEAKAKNVWEMTSREYSDTKGIEIPAWKQGDGTILIAGAHEPFAKSEKYFDEHGFFLSRYIPDFAWDLDMKLAGESERSEELFRPEAEGIFVSMREVDAAGGDVHKAAVTKALTSRKPVPPEVIAEYPDLKPALPKAEVPAPPPPAADVQEPPPPADLPTPPKEAIVPQPAAPSATITPSDRAASTPTQASGMPGGVDVRQGTEMAVVPGAIPGPGAAVPQLRPRKKIEIDLGDAEQKLVKLNSDLKRMEKLGESGTKRTRLEGQIKKAEDKVAAFKSELAERDRIFPRVSAKAKGFTRFDNETRREGEDILSWIKDTMPLMSRTAAKAKGEDFWRRNQGDWDGAIDLRLPPHHNVAIYGDGGSAPDQVAQAAYDAGVLSEPTPQALWDEIRHKSKVRMGSKTGETREEIEIKAQEAEHIAWVDATKRKAKGKNIEVAPEKLSVGDVLEVDRQELEVVSVTAEGDVELKDGRKFGIVKLHEDSKPFWVEKWDKAGDADFLPAEEPAPAPAPKPKPQPSTKLTDSENKELSNLVLKDRANRDAIGRGEQGVPLSEGEQKRYEELTAKAGQGSLFDVQEVVSGNERLRLEAELRNLERKLEEMYRQRDLAQKNMQESPVYDSKFKKDVVAWMKAIGEANQQVAELKRKLGLQQAPIELEPAEPAPAAPAEPDLFSAHPPEIKVGTRITLSGGDKFHQDITGLVVDVKNNGRILEILPDGEDPTLGATRITVEDYKNVKPAGPEAKPISPPKPPAPIPDKKEVELNVTGAAATPAGVPHGTKVGRYVKHTDGRWYMLEEDGSLALKENGQPKRIPTNKGQSEKLEASALQPPAPLDTRTPIEILNKAKHINVVGPEGSTMFRITDVNGKTSIVRLTDFKGANPAFQADIVKIEGGSIGSDKKFKPIPGEVKITEQKHYAAPDQPIYEDDITRQPTRITGREVPAQQAQLVAANSSRVREAVDSVYGQPTPGEAVGVHGKGIAERVLGQLAARGASVIELAQLGISPAEIFRRSVRDWISIPSSKLKAIGSGNEAVAFRHRTQDVIFKVFIPQKEGIGIFYKGALLPDGRIDANVRRGTIPELVEKLDLLNHMGGTPTEIVGLTKEGMVVVKQPLRERGSWRLEDISSEIERMGARKLGEDLVDADYPADFYGLVYRGEPWIVGDYRDANLGLDTQKGLRVFDHNATKLSWEDLAKNPKAEAFFRSLKDIEGAGLEDRMFAAPDATPEMRQGVRSVFYSRLTRTVEQSQQGKATGAQWKATIRNSKLGANADEMGLVGVGDLEDGKVYTKQEVLDYLKANEIQVKDVTLGGEQYEVVQNQSGSWSVVDRYDRGRYVEPEPFDDQLTAIEFVRGLGGNHKQLTQFSQYTLPGAKAGSYREVLLTVPESKEPIHTTSSSQFPRLYQKSNGRWTIEETQNEFADWAASDSAEETMRKFRGGGWNDGHQQYSDVPNPIVRLRFNERTTPDGKRLLFIEELQPPQKGEFSKMPVLFQKNWREIGFKWALRYAAENGFDAIGWTTGEMQAERYDLSKHLSRIEWRYDPDKGDYLIEGWGHDRSERAIYTTVKEDKLEATVGKEIAKQILDSPQVAKANTMKGQQIFADGIVEGADLKVGGEGLKKLYDQDFRNVVNSLPAVKKSGQKVGEIGIRTGLDTNFDVERKEAATGRWERVRGFDSEEQAKAEVDRLTKKYSGDQWNREYRYVPTPSDKIPTLTLTPDIRESVLGGQPIAATGELAKRAQPDVLISSATKEINDFLGTSELPGRVSVVHDPKAPFAAVIVGRDRITINTARIDEGQVIPKLLEEGMHGVWAEPELQAAVKELVREVRKADIAKQRLTRQGMDTRPETLTEEAAIARALESPGMFARLFNTIRRVFFKLFGVELPSSDQAREQVRQAALRFLNRKPDGGTGTEEVRYAAPDNPPPKEEAPREPRMANTQVAHEKVGVRREVEDVAEMQKRLRKSYFDGANQPVTPENTQTAWDIAQKFTNLAKRGEYVEQVAKDGGGQMAPGLLTNEIWEYAWRMAIRGDPKLARFMTERHQDFQLIDTSDPLGLGPTGVGRALASLRPRSTAGGLWNRLTTYTKEQLAIVGERLAMGREGLEQIISEIDGFVEKTLRDVDALDTEIRTPEIDKILDVGSKEHKAAAEIVAKFSPPADRKSSIMETVYQWLYREIDPNSEIDKQAFISSLITRLKELRLNDDQARMIAEETWIRRATVYGERRKRAWEAEIRKLDSLADKTAESFMLRVEQAEWKRPEQPNEVRDIIKEALKSQEPMDPNNLLGFTRNLREKLMTAGLSEATAKRLSDAIGRQREMDLTNARVRVRDRAAESKNIKSLLESLRSSPYLAQSDPAWRLETARLWFESNGVPPDMAVQAAKMFDAKFVEAMTRAAEKMAENLLKNTKSPRSITELVEAIRAGLLDPNKTWRGALADRAGFKPLSEEQFQKLAELEKKFADPFVSAHEQVALSEQMMGIMRHVGDPNGRFMRAVSESFAASLLSGVRTTTLNVLQPVVTLLTNYAVHSAFQIRDFPTLTRALVNAGKIWWPEAKFAWSRDAYSMYSHERVFHNNELKRIYEQAQVDWDKGRYVKAVGGFMYGWQQYVIRALQVADQAGMAVTREWKLALYGSIAMREAKLSTRQISELVDIAAGYKNASYQESIARGRTPTEAAVISNEDTAMAMVRFFGNHLGQAKAQQINEAAIYDSFSTVGRRAPGIEESDEGFLSRYTGLNWAMKRVAEARREGGGASMLSILAVGFMNVPMRTARYYAGFSPYGIIRWGIDHYRTQSLHKTESLWGQTYKNELQAKVRLREALVGTGMLLAFFGWQQTHHTSDDDAEKTPFGLFATGMGPSNKTMRDSWMKRGFQPYCINIVVAGKVVGWIPITRAGQIFSYALGMASATDDVAWRRKQEAASGNPRPEPFARELLASISTYYDIVGAQGVLQAFSHIGQMMRGERGMGRAIATSVASTAAATLVPGKSAIQWLTDMIWGPLDRSSAEAGIVANFPVVNALWNGKAINRFGDPVGDTSWASKFIKSGVPFVVRVADTPKNRELYQTILDKGAAPPDLRRYIVEEKYGPLDQDTWQKFVKASGDHLKQSVTENLEILKEMDPQSAKEFLNRAGEAANNQAATDVGLVSQGQSGGYYTGGGGSGTRISMPGAIKVGLPTGIGSVGGGGGRTMAGSMPSTPRIGTGSRYAPAVRRLAGGGGRVSSRSTSRRMGKMRLVTGRLRPHRVSRVGFRRKVSLTGRRSGIRRRRLTLKG